MKTNQVKRERPERERKPFNGIKGLQRIGFLVKQDGHIIMWKR